jgi:hypothetical protein
MKLLNVRCSISWGSGSSVHDGSRCNAGIKTCARPPPVNAIRGAAADGWLWRDNSRNRPLRTALPQSNVCCSHHELQYSRKSSGFCENQTGFFDSSKIGWLQLKKLNFDFFGKKQIPKNLSYKPKKIERQIGKTDRFTVFIQNLNFK